MLVLAPACPRSEEAIPPPPPLDVLPPQKIAELGTEVRCGALHRSGLVAGGTEAGSVLVSVSSPRGTRPRVFGEPRLHQGPVASLHFSSDGKHLLSAGGKLVIWWSTESGTAERNVTGPQQITTALLRESASGPVAYFGTGLGAMVRWPVRDRGAQPMRELACPALPVLAARRQLAEAERCPFGAFVEAEDGSGAACVYPVTALALAGSTLWRACREGSLYSEELDTHVRRGFGSGFVHAIAVRPDGLLLLARDDGDLRLLDAKRGRAVGELQPAGVAQAAASAGKLLAVAQGQKVLIFVGPSRRPSAEFQAAGRVVAMTLQESPPEIRILTAAGRAEARPLRRRYAGGP